MTEPITPARFHEADGIEDWRVLFGGAHAHFRTGSFAAGVALVDAIGRLADAADHPTWTHAFAPAWWTLADAEGNEADIATWMGCD